MPTSSSQFTDQLPLPVLMLARELGWGGGIERDVSKFARHLAKYGVSPHVACFRAGGARWDEIQSAGIPTLTIPVNSVISPSALRGARSVKAYVQEHGIQVLHAFDFGADLFTVPLGRVLGIPTLASQLWCRSILPPGMQLAFGALDRLASGLFVNCNAVADELATKWRVPKSRIHVCYNGYEIEEFHSQDRKRPPELQDASVVLGTIAVFREEKRISLLVDAFARVLQSNPKAKLALVGDGPMKSELEARTSSLNVRHACLFREPTPSPAEWMRAIDIYVMTSRSEAFPNALLEAMACGCCPVATRVGGIPELVNDGETGLLFESGNLDQLVSHLGALTADAPLRTRFAAAAAASVRERLTIDRAAQRLATIYRTLAGVAAALPRKSINESTRGQLITNEVQQPEVAVEAESRR